MTIKNEKYAGKTLFSSVGVLKFDDKGVVVEPKLKEGEEKELAKLTGFEIIDEKKENRKAEKEEKEVKAEEPKKGEKKAKKEEKLAEKEEEKPKRKKRTTKSKEEDK